MKNIFPTRIISLLFISLLLINCSDDDNGPADEPIENEPTTFEIIANSDNHTTLEQVLIDTGLDQVLNDGSFTVFAPTDAAFEQVNLSGLSDDELTNVLLNHVVNGTATSSDLSNTYLNTEATESFTGDGNKLSLLVNVDNGVTLNGSANVTAADLAASNGVVHVTDAVIVPPDLTTFAANDPQLSTLLSALTRDDQPDFVSTLATPVNTDPAPFTVFAPTNDAFADVLNELGVNSLADIEGSTLTSTLNFHVVPGANVTASDLATGPVTTLEDDVTVDADNATITDANGRVSNITITDVQTTNGVIHLIDKVILPVESVPTTFEIIADSDNHTTLEQVLIDTGLDQVLNDGSFTVFAPTDAAFEQVNLSGLSDDELTNVLLNHVVNGTATSSDLSNTYLNTEATESFTGDGNKLSLLVNVDNGVTLNGSANVTAADLTANNGVVHVTDAVILPPDLTTFAANDPQLSTLLSALTRDDQPDFVSTLATPANTDPAPFTVFAPTNDAFADVLNELGANSLADIEGPTLTSTLNFHVVPGANVTASDLATGPVTTLEGDVTVDAENATITDANGRVSTVTFTDIQTTNGVIHLIDKVILPEIPGLEGNQVVSLTLANDGASAYYVSEQNGGSITTLNENNSSWSLEVGQRYEITIVNPNAHPLMLRNSADEVLLGMDNGGSGSFQNDSEVNFVSNQSDGSFNFTVTQDLADVLDNYACQIHISSMQGPITIN